MNYPIYFPFLNLKPNMKDSQIIFIVKLNNSYGMFATAVSSLTYQDVSL